MLLRSKFWLRHQVRVAERCKIDKKFVQFGHCKNFTLLRILPNHGSTCNKLIKMLRLDFCACSWFLHAWAYLWNEGLYKFHGRSFQKLWFGIVVNTTICWGGVGGSNLAPPKLTYIFFIRRRFHCFGGPCHILAAGSVECHIYGGGFVWFGTWFAFKVYATIWGRPVGVGPHGLGGFDPRQPHIMYGI